MKKIMVCALVVLGLVSQTASAFDVKNFLKTLPKTILSNRKAVGVLGAFAALGVLYKMTDENAQTEEGKPTRRAKVKLKIQDSCTTVRNFSSENIYPSIKSASQLVVQGALVGVGVSGTNYFIQRIINK